MSLIPRAQLRPPSPTTTTIAAYCSVVRGRGGGGGTGTGTARHGKNYRNNAFAAFSLPPTPPLLPIHRETHRRQPAAAPDDVDEEVEEAVEHRTCIFHSHTKRRRFGRDNGRVSVACLSQSVSSVRDCECLLLLLFCIHRTECCCFYPRVTRNKRPPEFLLLFCHW